MSWYIKPSASQNGGGAGPVKTSQAVVGRIFRASLSGFNEVPPKLTPATGAFRARILANGNLQYQLSYQNLSAPSTAAHIHFGQPGVNGGIMAFLCGGGGKPACPLRSGTVTGVIRPADVQAIPGQGLAAGDLSGVLRIMRAGVSYANVHSTRFPDGEIRGQIR